MNGFQLLIFLLLCVFFSQPMTAQGSKFKCYQDSREQGLLLWREKKYDEANNQFFAALITCEKPPNDDLIDLIKGCQAEWVNDLEVAAKQEKAAHRMALVAQREAEAAKVSEEKARKEAEANARLAREQGIKVESLRLSLLSEKIRLEGRKSDALTLAYLSLQMLGTDMTAIKMRAFGEAVRDSMIQTLFTSPNTVETLQQAGKDVLLIKTTAGPFYILKRLGANDLPNRFVQLDANFTHAVPAPEGNLLLAWGPKKIVQLLNGEGMEIATLSGHTEAVRCAAFSPDGELMATGSRDNTARLWNREGKLLHILQGHTGNVHDIGFSSDGTFLYTRAADGTARTWDNRGNPIAVLEIEGKFLRQICLAPAGNRLAGIFADGSAAIWSSDGKLSGELEPGNKKIHGDFLFAQDASFGVARLDGPTAGIWSADGHLQALLKHPSDVVGLFISADGTQILSWAKDRIVRLWSTDGLLVKEFFGHQLGISGAFISADNAFVLTSSRDHTVKLWDAAGTILTEWQSGTALPAQFSEDGLGIILCTNDGRSLAFSPFPENIYQSMDRERILAGDRVAQLFLEFNVQFADALLQSK